MTDGTDRKPHHIRILSDAEINDLYARPQLTEDEMALLFELDAREAAILHSGLSIERKVDAIIQLGFFRKKKRFFEFNFSDVAAEARYIAEIYFGVNKLQRIDVGRTVHNQNRQWILEMTGYTLYKKEQHFQMLYDRALELCRLSSDPVTLFRQLLEFLDRNKISLPGYTTLQERVISAVLSSEQQRLAKLLHKHMSATDREMLISLIKQPETGFYAVTSLKHQPKNFSATAIRREVSWYENYQPLYQIAKHVVSKLGISRNAVDYYAGLVEHFSVHSMNRTNTNKTCLWLLCFMRNRYHRMMDNLAVMYIHTANKYETDVQLKSKELLTAESVETSEKDGKVASMLKVFVDPSVKDHELFGKIRQAVFTTIMTPAQIQQIVEEMIGDEHQKKRPSVLFWHAVDEYAATYLPLLRLLASTLTVKGDACKSLQQAFYFLKAHSKMDKPLSKTPFDEFPIRFIEKDKVPFIYNDAEKSIHRQRYEYECYRLLANRLNGRALALQDSVSFASLESMLLPDWQQTKKSVVKKLDRPLLTMPFVQFIEEKAKPLDERIIRINEDIRLGKNDSVRIKKMKNGSEKWTLPYTKKQLELNNPFYEMLPKVGIVEVLQFVEKYTGFIAAFTHIKPHYSKSGLDELSLYACLLANGTNLGIGKMSTLCDMNQQQLITTEKNFMRLSTIRTAWFFT